MVALAPGEFLLRLLVAMLLGLGIGLEREYRSDTPRAAGMRTLALVAMGSALFTLISAYGFAAFRVTTDPSRVAAQIVTGIGFLGAGVIVKEGFSLRGLTTAASIWVASAIGVVLGAGSYWTGLAAAVVTLVALSILRQVEDRLPSQTFVHFVVGFDRAAPMNEARLREMVHDYGFRVSDVAYRLDATSQSLEYRAVIWSKGRGRLEELQRALLTLPDVLHFRISPRRE